MIYVDSARHRLGRLIMSHMTADTLAELHAAADAIGLKRSWFQGPPGHRHAHYDLCQSNRARVIGEFSAEIVSSRDLAYRARKLAMAISTPKGRRVAS